MKIIDNYSLLECSGIDTIMCNGNNSFYCWNSCRPESMYRLEKKVVEKLYVYTSRYYKQEIDKGNISDEINKLGKIKKDLDKMLYSDFKKVYIFNLNYVYKTDKDLDIYDLA